MGEKEEVKAEEMDMKATEVYGVLKESGLGFLSFFWDSDDHNCACCSGDISVADLLLTVLFIVKAFNYPIDNLHHDIKFLIEHSEVEEDKTESHI